MVKKLISILPPEMKGVMHVSGYRGLGKTFLATQADFPQNIAFFDFEDKGEGIHNQLSFGYYKAISQAENTPLARGKLILEEIEKLPKDKFIVAILDNIRPLEDGLLALIKSEPHNYGKPYGKEPKQITANIHGSAYGVLNEIVVDRICKPLYTKGIKLIIITSHVKQRYEGYNQVFGKMKVQGKDKWQELSILTLILIDGDNHPIPSAIVQKEQLALTEIKDEYTSDEVEKIMSGDLPAHIITRRLPYRMPEATFQKLRWYLSHPASFDEPAKGEKLIDEEIQPFIEQLSKEQIAIHLLSLQSREREENDLNEIVETANGYAEIKEKVKSLNGSLSPVQIRKQIKEEYNRDISTADIMEWSK